MHFYRRQAVRERIAEFLGLDADCDGGAVSVRSVGRSQPLPVSALPELLEDSAEIERSLWDRTRLIADLDIEYVNHDYPGEPFLDPRHAFATQKPVATAMQETLADFGIFPFHMMSGRGRHFVWSMGVETPACNRLSALGSCWARSQRAPFGVESDAETVPRYLERAFVGLGMCLEWVAHRTVASAGPRSPVSVQFTDVRVGSGRRGRECVSIDLSEYGDPLHTRFLHAPFSFYRKPKRRQDVFGPHVAAETPEMVAIPVFEMSEAEAISVMRNPERAADLAKRAPARIPDAATGALRLFEAYSASSLAAFHRRYYAAEPDRVEHVSENKLDVSALPPCAAKILEHPNDLLLQPVGMQHIVRVLLALGWEPRAIARLIQSKFEEDHRWGDRWTTYDPARRADFYTRLFSGAIACGVDGLVDFNTISHIEKGCCSAGECGCDLSVFRRSLQERVHHERLGRRPFNRLFSA